MAQPYAQAIKRMDLRDTAVAANGADLPFLETKRVRLHEVVTEVRKLTGEQANLTARKQDVSKRLAELVQEGNTLVTFIDVGVKQHYGIRAEKLAEFGLQPFRGRPKVVFVGPDGKRLKAVKTVEEPPAPPVVP